MPDSSVLTPAQVEKIHRVIDAQPPMTDRSIERVALILAAAESERRAARSR